MHLIRPFAIGAVALVVGVADIPEGVQSWQPWTALVGVLGALALAARRVVRPVGAFVTLASLIGLAVGAHTVNEPGQIPFGLFVITALLIADVVWSCRLAVIGVLIPFAVVTAVAAEGLADDRELSDVLFLGMLWALGGAVALSIRWWRQATDSHDEQVRMLERQRIARDLHDTVAHHVSAIALTAEGARGLVGTDSAVVDRSLDSIHTTAAAALDEMRRTVSILRDDVDSPPLTLAGLTTSIDTGGSLDVDFSISENLGNLHAPIVGAVHRIVQESVTNARRHAVDATAVTVDIREVNDRIRVSVFDDGRGSSPMTSRGFGLAGMRERVELLGGTFHAGQMASGGWSVEAELPREMST